MYKRCKNNCCGDFSDLTEDSVYEVLEIDNEYLIHIDVEGNRITEVRYLVRDDSGETYWYPEYCFAEVLH